MSDTAAKKLYAADAPQRMALLTGIPQLLSEFGVSLDQALSGLPIEPEVFSDEERRIPYSVATELLRRSAQLTKCDTFGLLLGSRYDHRCLGAPGLWMQHAPDLETALSGFVELQRGNSRGASVYLHRYGDAVIFGYGVYEGGAVAHEQIYALIEALAFNTVRALTRVAAKPSEVLFSFRRPADATPYAEFFRVPVRFDQPETGLVLPLTALAAPIPGARPDERARLERLAAANAPPSDRVWTDRVRHAVRPLILRGEPTSLSAAAQFKLNVRTLSRYLASEGTTFQAILDDVRFAKARELLAVTTLPIGEIAHALSYASHPPFIDAFRRWSGVTPSEWRRDIRSE
jgi:AraC-like DNA-binding protein